MKIIVGLGNPGKKYENTYHNMGYKVIEKVAENLGKKLKDKNCMARTCVFSKNGEKIILALPETFMNLSGESVQGLLKKYDATIDDLLVVYDDIDISCGLLRLREAGSPGTHNGMKNIVQKTNSKDFKRIRVGIGKKPAFMDIVDYVLSDAKGQNKELTDDAINRASDCVVEFINGQDFQSLMQNFNKKD